MWNGLKQHFCRDLCKFTFLGGFAFHGSTSARVQTRPTHHVACGNASLHPRVRRSGTLFSCEPEEERLTHVERRNAKKAFQSPGNPRNTKNERKPPGQN